LTELYGLSAIPPNDDIMLRAANLPDFHKDPADRMIIATALISGMPIVTGDGKFSQYGVKTIC
jgi:PIN domain nuclease of toxin-antitoxin system